MTEDINLSFNKKEAEILLNSLNLSKELNLLPDDSHLLTALINKTYDVAKNLIDEHIFTKAKINRLEQKLKDSDNKYRIFVEHFPGIAFQGYQDFSAAFIDGNIEEMTGYTEEDFTSGRIKWDNIIYPDDLERIIKLVKKFHSTSMNSDIREYRIINKNGKVRWVMENIQKLYDNGRKEETVKGTIIDITNSKLAEQKLKESEKKYRDMITYSDVGFYNIEINGLIINHNLSFNKILGYHPSEDLIGLYVTDFWQNPELRKDYLEEIMKTGFVKNYIVHSKKKNREKIILQINSHLIKDDNGKPIKIEGTIIDITDKFRLEQELKESEEKYRSILENMQDGYYEVDLQGNFTFVNNYLCNYLGYSREELLGRNYQEFLDKDTIKEVFNKFNQVYKDEIPRNTFETYVIRNDGKKRFIEGTIYLKYDSQGKKVGFSGFSQDTTEHKKIEELLLENEDKYRTLFEQAADSILLIDEESGELVEFNNKTYENLGYSREEFKNIKIPDFEIIESPEEVKKHLEKIVREGADIFETKHRTKNGEIRNVIVSSKAINIRGRNFVQSIYRDITERKKAEKELRESETRYRDFVSVASHEFKTPLIPIIGIPQLLLKDTNLTEKQKDFINEIYHSGKKLNNLIDNLLDTSQIDIKIIQLDKQEIEINPLIKQCISDLSFLIKQKNHKLIKRLQEDVILNVDDKKFSRVLTNLISNAIKFSPQNGKIEISTYVDDENNFIFSIKDNGVGIEEKDQDLIFQKFGKIRGEEIAKYKLNSYGSGLGLFISREIINLHGGEMRFESAGKNNGTTFYFKLPRK